MEVAPRIENCATVQNTTQNERTRLNTRIIFHPLVEILEMCTVRFWRRFSWKGSFPERFVPRGWQKVEIGELFCEKWAYNVCVYFQEQLLCLWAEKTSQEACHLCSGRWLVLAKKEDFKPRSSLIRTNCSSSHETDFSSKYSSVLTMRVCACHFKMHRTYNWLYTVQSILYNYACVRAR